MTNRFHILAFRVLFIVFLASFLVLTNCKKAEVVPKLEIIQVFSQLLPENYLFYSEDGGLWALNHIERKIEGQPELVVAQRFGPVFLPETEDVSKTLTLQIMGIRKTESLGSSKQPYWWYLDYSYKQSDNNPKAVTVSLQIQLDGQWYLLPSSGYTQDQQNSINLMKGRLYPNENERITPGHYRLVLLRDWRGEISLDIEEFDLLKTEDEYSIEYIHKPSDLCIMEAKIPSGNIFRQDGSSWSIVKAGSLDFWHSMTDILEARVSS